MAPIVLVDDLAEDRCLFEAAYEAADVDNPALALAGGEEAKEHLARVEAAAVPSPCVVLLDLNMPRVSGFDVLDWAAGRPGLSHVPIVVFTSSDRQADMTAAYGKGASGYLIKPHDFSGLKTLIRSVGSYWCDHNQRPEIGRGG